MAAEFPDPKALRDSLAGLAARSPDYAARIADAGFECCHVNERWIRAHCGAEDLAVHQRYSIEYAAEVLAADDPFAVLNDKSVCRSDWLNDLKAERLTRHGSFEALHQRPGTRHLAELSPGWREFMRVRESSAAADREQVREQGAEFLRRRAIELRAHDEALARCRARLPQGTDALSLQAFFAKQLVEEFAEMPASSVFTLRRNQALQRDEQVVAVTFAIAGDCQFVLLPVVVASASAADVQGTLGVGFRLMTSAVLAAPKFEFGRETVLQLSELLPGKFNDYGRFDKPEEFCLNVLAWTAALRVLVPDVLQTLSAVARVPAPSQLH